MIQQRIGDSEDMTEHHTPDEPTSSDELLEELQSADPAEAPDVAESLANSLADDLTDTEPLRTNGVGETP